MLIVLPVSQADIDIALTQAQWIKDLGGTPHHTALCVFPPKLDLDKKNCLIGIWESITDKNYILNLSECNENGWPESANDMFKQTCFHLSKNTYDENIWYWFEADNTPLRRDWVSILAADYYLKGKRCYGQVFRHHTPNGEPEVLMMAGTGIYPIDVDTYIPSYRTIGKYDFDSYIRHDVNKSLVQSPYIHWNWCAYNYTCQHGCLFQGVGNHIRQHKMGPCSVTLPEASPVSLKAVVSHGCKDGSLIQCLRENDFFQNCDDKSQFVRISKPNYML